MEHLLLNCLLLPRHNVFIMKLHLFLLVYLSKIMEYIDV